MTLDLKPLATKMTNPDCSWRGRTHFVAIWALASIATIDTIYGTVSDHFPGPQNPIGVSSALILMVCFTAACFYAAVSRQPTAKGLSRSVFASLPLAAMYIHRRIEYGTDDTFVQNFEAGLIFIPIICFFFTAYRHLRGRSLSGAQRATALAVFVVITGQTALHGTVAQQAARSAYGSISQELISAQTFTANDINRLSSWLSLDPAEMRDYQNALPTGVIEEARRSIVKIEQDAPRATHAWAIPYPLENLPRTEAIVIYDGSASPSRAFIRTPETLVTAAIPYLQAHIAITALLFAALITYLARSTKISN